MNLQRTANSVLTVCLSQGDNRSLIFRLADDGQIELSNIGETTHDFVMETCYPELDKAQTTAELDEAGLEYSEKGQEQIRQAVELERKRLWDSQARGKEAETALGRDIQKQLGAASVLVDRLVREAAKKRLQSLAQSREIGAKLGILKPGRVSKFLRDLWLCRGSGHTAGFSPRILRCSLQYCFFFNWPLWVRKLRLIRFKDPLAGVVRGRELGARMLEAFQQSSRSHRLPATLELIDAVFEEGPGTKPGP